jgi:hypothetical protein
MPGTLSGSIGQTSRSKIDTISSIEKVVKIDDISTTEKTDKNPKIRSKVLWPSAKSIQPFLK